MPTRSLPPRPDLSQLKLQARELHRALGDGHVSAAARVAASHPRFKGQPLSAILDAPPALADAQLALAREYGFHTWSELKRRVALGSRIDRVLPHPRFAEALEAFDAGDVVRLKALLASDPSLVHARTNLDPPYGYFTGATLLHHVAGNPGRDRPLPANVVDEARVLLLAGADPHAQTLGPSPSSSTSSVGSSTMGLVVTSKQASDMDVSGPLIDLLRAYGVHVDLDSDSALDGALANHAPRAAEKLIALGAKPDMVAAAALGRLDLVRSFFDADGRLTSPLRRQGRDMDDRDAVGLAALYAYVRHQPAVVDFLLEKTGNWDMIGVNNGTLLHRAAWAGDLPMVQRLVALGADINNRNNPYRGTPMDWAWHNNQREAVQWIQDHCAVDLHNAVAYDLREQVAARLREDPASVNGRLDDGDIALGTPLHSAARLNRVEIAALLCDRGAYRDALAGDGTTPLDVAEAHGSAGVAALLDERGARRAGDAPSRAAVRARPAWDYDESHDTIRLRVMAGDAEWEAAIAALAEKKASGFDARGQMTDARLARVADVGHVTRIELEGSAGVSDAGVAHLSRLRLQYLDLSGTGISDEGLAVLRDLPELRTFRLSHEGVTDRGLSHLAACERLERVEVFPGAGAGLLRSLSAKPSLRRLAIGRAFTEGDLAMLREFPALRTWQGAALQYGLMDFEAGPTSLRAYPASAYSRRGLEHLRGLDGLFSLNLDNPVARDADIAPLMDLPNLGWLGFDADDSALRRIGELPRLRMLMAQDTRAGDDGFVGLSRSASLEYIWGRRCYGLTGRGFAALSSMPSLRGLSVSCRNVDDAALATLPRFPALRELMPMDVSDDGFRHVGRCEALEALWCMYCRSTTDAATAHIAGLSRLKRYYAGRTKITDRSLEILAGMPSLERLEFWSCAGITNSGVARLAALPRLREVTIDDCRQVTADVAAMFPAGVRVRVVP